MNDLDDVAAQLEGEAEAFMAFTGARTPSPDDRFILVMGLTGSGKSTFVANCTGRQVTIGHDLTSCTSSIAIYDYHDHEGRRVYLIDTPGFDDTDRSDAETLEVLGTYLSASYSAGVRIDGVVFLHRITDVRVGGSGVRNLAMLRAMCDLESYARFTFGTTMWSAGGEGDRGGEYGNIFAAREDSLRTDPRFFDHFLSRGADMKRLAHNHGGRADPTGYSPRAVVAHLLARAQAQPPMVLRIQRELVVEQTMLAETLAGQVVFSNILAAQREHAQQLRELQLEITAEERARGREHAAVQELRGDQQALRDEVLAADIQMQSLRVSMAELHQRERDALDERIEELDRKFRERLEDKNQELIELEASVRFLQEDLMNQKAAREREEERLNLMRRAREDRARRDWADKSRDGFASSVYLDTDAPPPYPVIDDGHQQSSKSDQLMKHLEKEKGENAAMVQELRAQVEQYRQSYSKVQGAKGNLRNGAMNGLAAGITSGTIAAVGAAALCVVM